jgi:flagellar protein FliS
MVTVSAIANASQGELLCITYELFLYNIEQALKEETEKKKVYRDKAVEILKTLTEDLNFEAPIANNLFQLYIYIQGVLLQYDVTNKKLEHIYKVMNILYKGFLEAAEKEGQSEPSMKNAETIYAGMTYGKSDLNEVVFSDQNRGFKA